MNSEQIKKLILGIFCLIGLLYVYFTFFLGPLHHSEEAMKGKIAELQARTASSKTEIMKAANLEANARTATSHYDALRALSPEGAPIAWFPPRMKTFFAEQRIDKATVRLDSTNSCKEKDLTAWSRSSWTIDLPQADFITLGKAIAKLENTQPLLSIKKLAIRGSADSPEFQQVTLAVTTLIDTK